MEFEFSKNAELETLDTVPEQFRSVYKQEGEKFVINPDMQGVVEAVEGLNKSLKASRAEAKQAKSKTVDLSPLKDFGETPEDIKAAIDSKMEELQTQLADADGKDAKLNLEKVKTDLQNQHQRELQAHQQRVEALQTQLYDQLVSNEATKAISEEKGVPELLMPFIKDKVKVQEEDGKFAVFVVDEQGDQRFSGVTGQPMSIKELVGEMKQDQRFGRLFESETPSGGGANPRGASRSNQQSKAEPMSATQKIAAGLTKGQARPAGR